MATGAFWPDAGRRAAVAHLDQGALARKGAALSCYRSQADIIRLFSPDPETYRLAPRYNFANKPPPGLYLYDSFGWTITSTQWQRHAARALAQIEKTAA